jgi:hypothetical protein
MIKSRIIRWAGHISRMEENGGKARRKEAIRETLMYMGG